MTSTHESKPSYFGDQVTFAFPSSDSPSGISSIENVLELNLSNKNNEDGDDDDQEKDRTNHNQTYNHPGDCTTTTIERAGSIFIKSGIPKVKPFADSFNNVSDSPTKSLSIKTKPINITEKVLPSTPEKEDISKRVFSPQTSLLKNRDSLRQINYSRSSVSTTPFTRSFVNPYLKGSILRKHKEEVENDEMLKNRVISMRNNNILEDDNNSNNENENNNDNDYDDTFEIDNEDTPFVKEKTEELKIPRRSSKRVTRFGGFSTGSILRYKSVNTLNSSNGIKRSNNSFKSVDMSGLDNLLGELLTYKDVTRKSSGVDSINKLNKTPARSPTTKKSTRIVSNLNQIQEHKKLEILDSDSTSIKPFDVSKSIHKSRSLARSISNASEEIELLKKHQYDPSTATSSSRGSNTKTNTNVSTNTQYNKPLPKVKEEKHVEKCELKRSNAVKRKWVLIEYLINIFNSIKNASKKSWRLIKGSFKKNVLFRRKSLIKKDRNVVKVKISDPVLVDINETAFKSQVLNKSTHPSISKKLKENEEYNESLKSISNKSSPLFSNGGRMSSISGKSGSISGSYSTDSKNGKSNQDNENILETEILSEKRLSTIPSISELGEMNEFDEKNKQLVMLWRHYLGISIKNRIDMKVDLNKVNMIERIKAIQSDLSRKKSLDINGKIEIEKIMQKYVTYDNTSRSSTISTGIITSPLSFKGNNRRFTNGSGNSWATVDSSNEEYEYVSVNDDYGYSDRSSISTIGEESSDFDGIRSGSTLSSMSDLSDVYDEYSLLSDRDEDESSDDYETRDDSGTMDNHAVTKSPYKLGSKKGQIKQSDRIMNFQSVLKKKNSVYSSTTSGSGDGRWTLKDWSSVLGCSVSSVIGARCSGGNFEFNN
ncbi:hypothetical protein C6P42_001719 [Pichia californica]|nr:hypothetical protein C6P42_001719 [[Candida] californica]